MHFLEINDIDDTDPANVWETTKAYLRGLMISYCVARKRKIIYEQKRLESKLQEAETKHKHSLYAESWDQVMVAKTVLNSLEIQKTERELFLQKYKQYDSHRSVKYLASLINNKKRKSAISKIRDKSGKLVYTSGEITNVFIRILW